MNVDIFVRLVRTVRTVTVNYVNRHTANIKVDLGSVPFIDLQIRPPTLVIYNSYPSLWRISTRTILSWSMIHCNMYVPHIGLKLTSRKLAYQTIEWSPSRWGRRRNHSVCISVYFSRLRNLSKRRSGSTKMAMVYSRKPMKRKWSFLTKLRRHSGTSPIGFTPALAHHFQPRRTKIAKVPSRNW